MFAEEIEVELRSGARVVGVNRRVLASLGVGGVLTGVQKTEVDGLASSLTARSTLPL